LGSADGTYSDARFNAPTGVALDAAGNLYVADTFNNLIRKMTLDGTNWVVTTVAGLAGSAGSADGTGGAARFNIPTAVASDSTGTLYVADTLNDLIRKMTPAGTNWIVTTLAGTGGIYGSAEGRGADARFWNPSSVAVDSAKNLYIADRINHTIRRVTAAGEVTTLAGRAGYGGSVDGTGNEARFSSPSGVAVDSAGIVYVADTWNCTIRKVTPAGVVTTLAGQPVVSGGNDGTNSQAQFVNPLGLAVDKAGNLYVADTWGATIRKVTPVGSNWVVTTLAGRFDIYDFRNATGTNAWFNLPASVAVDSTGNVYVADVYNHVIRKVTSAGTVTTFAGGVGQVGSVDGTGTAARFYAPTGVAVDSADNLYVADTYNNTIRKVTLNRVVTTVGGMAGFYGTADGTGSVARFSNPTGVAVDADGTIYVADLYFGTIRKGTPPTTLLQPGRELTGEFGFALSGTPGRTVIVEASNELLTWRPIWTNALGPGLQFRDPQSAGDARRFYRARLP
jgi:sugar lactone lactonase YvrE